MIRFNDPNLDRLASRLEEAGVDEKAILPIAASLFNDELRRRRYEAKADFEEALRHYEAPELEALRAELEAKAKGGEL